ncbi:MAG: LamG domain-containing protein [Planctomycetota bacterium]
MRKWQILTITGLVVFVCLSATANAAIVIEEQFIYEPVQANIDGMDGGTGFDGPWVSTISHGRIYWIHSPGLEFDTLPVAGNALSRFGSAGRAEAHRPISAASQAALTRDNTTIWFGQLFAGTAANRNAMFIFSTESIKHTDNPYQLSAPGDGFGFTSANISAGVGSNGDGSINAIAFDNSVEATFVKGTYTPAPLTATSLIVGKINWKPNGTPDELFLFNITDMSSEPAESEAFASITADLDQSAFDTVAMYDGTNSITDEIRFGNTFGDAVGTPITYAASNPDPSNGSRVPPDGDEGDGHWMLLEFKAGEGATTHTAYFSSNFDDVNDRNPAVSLGSPPYPGMYPTGYYVGLDDPTLPEFARTPLETDTIYYWAVDESNATSTYPGDVWSFTIASEKAWDPTPPDDAQYIDPGSVGLSWQLGAITNAGNYSITYNVYWGPDLAAVEAGTSDTVNVSNPTHTIGPLSGEEDYYWKVDIVLVKVVPPFDTTIIEGDIWHFTTLPAVPILDENLIGWWKLDGEMAPVLAFDSSGYGNHGAFNGDPTFVAGKVDNAVELDGSGDRIEVDTPLGFGGGASRTIAGWAKASTTSIGNWTNVFGFTSPAGAGRHFDIEIVGDTDSTTQGWFGLHLYNDEYDIIPNDMEWHHLAASWDGTNLRVYGDGMLINTAVPTVSININDRVHIGKRFDNNNHFPGIVDDVHIYDKVLSEREIKIVAGFLKASNPDPANGASDVPRTPTLTWTPGVFVGAVNGNILYYGYDASAVTARTATSVTLTSASYTLPLTLDLGETFYWAVDTVNGLGTWPGEVWSFKVRDWLAVDDMESYTPWTMPGNNIFEAWRDGEGNCNPGNGNQTGSTLTENMDTAFVHGDLQSMKYDYDNDGLVYSPCTMTQTPRPYNYSKIEAQIATLVSGIGTDWTIEGVKALSLRFYGLSTNGIEPMWVQLSDGTKAVGNKVTYGDYDDENPAAIAEEQWREWFIDMGDFGVNLTGVVSISIGFGNEDGSGAQGSGTVYFDDFRLYTPRCMPSRHSEAAARFDFAPLGAPDCVVNHKELEVMAENWLGTVPEMTPITVPDASFEDHVLAPGGYIDVNDPGYTGAWEYVSGDAWIDYGYWRADGWPEDLYAHSGNNKAYAYSDYIYQILNTTFIEGQVYTLQVWVGQPWAGDPTGWRLYLTTEDYTEELIMVSGSAGLTWGQVRLVYTATAADAGKKIGIKMWCEGDVAFDDVTLVRSSEPITADPRVNLHEDAKIGFKDFAVLADKYLDEELFP